MVVLGEELGREILDALAANVAVVDREGVVVACNQGWAAAAAEGRSAALGTSVVDAWERGCPEANVAVAGLARVLSGEAKSFQVDQPRAFGDEPRTRFWSIAVKAMPGSPSRALVVEQDVSAGKWAEQALLGHVQVLESIASGAGIRDVLEEIVRFVEDQIRGGLCSVLLRDGAMLLPAAGASIPTQYTEALGPVPIGPGVGCCGTAAHLGEPVIVADIATDPLWTAFRHLALPHGLRACWSVPILASGPDRSVLGTFALYRTTTGRPTEATLALLVGAASLACVAIERARALGDLRESEERSRLLVDGIQDAAVFLVDVAGTIQTWNQAAQRVYGYAPGEVVGAHVSVLDEPDRDWSTSLPIDSGETREVEVGQVRKGGEPFWAGVVTTALENEDGTVRGYAKVVRDLTARRSLEEQLRHAQKMEAVGRLAGGVAHDFNNLLTVVLTNAELLALDPNPQEILQESLGEIQAAGTRAAELTRQLLAFSRKQVLEPVVLDLNQVVRDCEKLLRRVLGERIALESDLGVDLAPIRADRGQLEQVLVNLAVNARDAMPEGGKLSFTTRVVDVPAGESDVLGPSVELVVADTGCGMSEETRAKVFEPFFTTKPAGQGTGLGLAVVYGIVRQSGGDIAVDSAPGGGARFRIRFPAVAGEQPRVASGTRLLPPRGAETVLVVEDDAAVRRVVVRALGAHGYSVIEARNPGEALARIRSAGGEVDLLVTDVVMPDVTGPELVAQARRVAPALRVLFVSGYTEDLRVLESIGGTTGFLPKPFTPSVLCAKVREMLGDSRAAAP